MGQFKLEVTAVGGHGCSREVGDGGTVYGCGRIGCPDCQFWNMLAHYVRTTGAHIESAKLTHWPGTPQEVVDELDLSTITNPLVFFSVVPRRRKGNF